MIKKQTVNKFLSSSVSISLLCMSIGGGCSIGISRAWTVPFYVEVFSDSGTFNQDEESGYENEIVIGQALDIGENFATDTETKTTYEVEGEGIQLLEKDSVSLRELRIEEDAIDRLNFAYYFDQEALSDDVSQSFAGKAYQVLAEQDSIWVNEIYNLRRTSPEQMAKRLGMDKNVVTGISHLKGVPVSGSEENSRIIPSWNRVNIVFRNGDGTPISNSSNVKQILSMASVYGYAHEWEDYDSFCSYVTKLWKASHSYKYSMSKVYYCQGECRFAERDIEEEPEDQTPSNIEGTTSPKDITSSQETVSETKEIVIEGAFTEEENTSSFSPSEPDDITQQHGPIPYDIVGEQSPDALQANDVTKHQNIVKPETFILLESLSTLDSIVDGEGEFQSSPNTGIENDTIQDVAETDKPSEPDDITQQKQILPDSSLESKGSLIPDNTLQSENSSETEDSVWQEKPPIPEESSKVEKTSKETDSTWEEKPSEPDETAEADKDAMENSSTLEKKPSEPDDMAEIQKDLKESDSVWQEKPSNPEESTGVEKGPNETDSTWEEKPSEPDDITTRESFKESDNHLTEPESSDDETNTKDDWESPADGIGDMTEDEEVTKGNSQKNSQFCYGHVDLSISAVVIGFEGKRNLFSVDPSGSQNTDDSEQWNGWEAIYQDYVKIIAGQDWYTEYGLANTIGTYAANPLSASEINTYLSMLPADTSPKRRKVVQEALLSIGCIPYYWGGKPSGPGYEMNGFGRIVSPDEDGRILRGLDCSGWINWVYWTALGSNLPAQSTSGLMSCGRGIAKKDLKAGDILIRAGSERSVAHVYLFLAWAENGSMYLIHETTGNANNVTINTFDLDLPYYRCLINEE